MKTVTVVELFEANARKFAMFCAENNIWTIFSYSKDTFLGLKVFVFIAAENQDEFYKQQDLLKINNWIK